MFVLSLVPSEPPCIGNWFSSYVYESPPLDTALDFAISDCEEREYDKLDVVEKSASRNIKDSMASTDVKKPELCALNNTSDAVVKGPNIGKGTELDYKSMCKVCSFFPISLLCLLVVYMYSSSKIKLCFLLQGTGQYYGFMTL